MKNSFLHQASMITVVRYVRVWIISDETLGPSIKGTQPAYLATGNGRTLSHVYQNIP